MTEADKFDCAKRELAMREKMYPQWVSSGRMKPDVARWQIQCMAAIVEDYRKICEGERLI
jgi:hypothetical protein